MPRIGNKTYFLTEVKLIKQNKVEVPIKYFCFPLELFQRIFVVASGVWSYQRTSTFNLTN
jgi:hypothetical protein